MGKIVWYEHHGWSVAVDEEFQGLHRDHCLCYRCGKFCLEDRESNCPIANALYRFLVLTGLVTPVWECPQFEEIKGKEDETGA